MGAMQRNKGKRGEREVIAYLQPVLNKVYGQAGLEPPQLQRNALQCDSGGCDVVGLDWMAPEVKYCETLVLPKWWRQAEQQAKPHQMPVLFYRRNGMKWRVKLLLVAMAGRATCVQVEATMELPEFLRWFEARVQEELKK